MPSQIMNLIIQKYFEELQLEYSTAGLGVLLTDKLFQQQRTIKGGRFSTSEGYVYLSEVLYHNLITDEQKREIFKSPFEIGHPDKANGSYTDLINYLGSEYPGADPHDHLKDTKKFIAELTGISFDEYYQHDKSLAMKILTLFYRFGKQYRSKFFSFLRAQAKEKANYTYTSIQLCTSLSEQELANNVLLADFMTCLTYAMPKNYLKQINSIYKDLAASCNQMDEWIRSELNAYHLPDDVNNGRYSPEAVEPAIKNLVNTDTTLPSMDRLDFKIYTALTLNEYSLRSRANKLVSDKVYSNKLELKSLLGAILPTFSDKDVLTFLLGKPVDTSPELDLKAKFIEQIYLRKHPDIKELKPLNRQIIKAVILHDAKKGIKIQSTVQGAKNIPYSVTGVLNDVVRKVKDENKPLPDPLDYPEALTYYWYLRYKLAMKVLFAENQSDEHDRQAEIYRLNLLLDEKLVDYLKKQDMNGFQKINSLTKKFADSLGYGFNSPISA